MERNKYRLRENLAEDLMREAKGTAKYIIVFYLGYFFCMSSIQPKTLPEVTCKHELTVEMTGATSFIIPTALPRTGAEGQK